MPDRENTRGRFGAHNILEYRPADGPWKDLMFLTYFNAGLRAVDINDVLQPREVGYYVPALPAGQEAIRMRVFVIWVMGIVALGLLGSLIGWALAKNSLGEYVGAVAGACGFVCLRLWFAKPSTNSN